MYLYDNAQPSGCQCPFLLFYCDFLAKRSEERVALGTNDSRNFLPREVRANHLTTESRSKIFQHPIEAIAELPVLVST